MARNTVFGTCKEIFKRGAPTVTADRRSAGVWGVTDEEAREALYTPSGLRNAVQHHPTTDIIHISHQYILRQAESHIICYFHMRSRCACSRERHLTSPSPITILWKLPLPSYRARHIPLPNTTFSQIQRGTIDSFVEEQYHKTSKTFSGRVPSGSTAALG